MNELKFEELQEVNGGKQHKGLASDIAWGALTGAGSGVKWGVAGGIGGMVCGAAMGAGAGAVGAIGVHVVRDRIHLGD